MPNFGQCVCVCGVKSADVSVWGVCAWHVEARAGHRLSSSVTLCLVSEAGSLTGSSPSQLGWQATQDLSSCASQLQARTAMSSFEHGCWRSILSSSCLQSKSSYPMRHSQPLDPDKDG